MVKTQEHFFGFIRDMIKKRKIGNYGKEDLKSDCVRCCWLLRQREFKIIAPNVLVVGEVVGNNAPLCRAETKIKK